MERTAEPEGSFRGIVLILAATALWSTTPIFIQPLVTVHHLTPLDVSAWRAFPVTPVLGIIVLVRRPEAFRITRPEIPYLAACGIIGIALFNVLWSASVQVNKAPVATALVFSAPTFVALGSRFIFGERLGAARLAAVAMALLGCALVAGVRHPSALIHNPAGLELGLSSGAAFAAYTLFGKGASRLWGRSSAHRALLRVSFSALLLLVWGLAAQGWGVIALNTDTTGWVSAGFTGAWTFPGRVCPVHGRPGPSARRSGGALYDARAAHHRRPRRDLPGQDHEWHPVARHGAHPGRRTGRAGKPATHAGHRSCYRHLRSLLPNRMHRHRPSHLPRRLSREIAPDTVTGAVCPRCASAGEQTESAECGRMRGRLRGQRHPASRGGSGPPPGYRDFHGGRSGACHDKMVFLTLHGMMWRRTRP